MSETLTVGLALGNLHAGIADLRAQLIDTDGVAVGSAVSTGFFEVGNGFYQWTYDAFPDTFQGGAKFYSNATPATILAFLAFNPSSVVSGVNTVTITIIDATTLAALSDIQVTLRNSGDTATLDQKRTNANGQATFSRGDGTYSVHVGAIPGYASLAAQTLVVSGNTSASYSLTALVIGAPSTPDLCRVYGYEYLDGSPVAGREIHSALGNPPQTYGTVVLEIIERNTNTDSNGYWFFDLVIGKTYIIIINEAKVKHKFEVPNQATLDLSTLL